VPTETGEERLGEPWKTRVQVRSERKEDTQSTMYEGTWAARSLARRVEALTLSNPALMSKKRVETSSLGLWSILIWCVSARQASVELSPGRDPHWFGCRRPLDLAMADKRTVITLSRTFEMVFRRTMMRKEAGQS